MVRNKCKNKVSVLGLILNFGDPSRSGFSNVLCYKGYNE